MHVEHKVKVNGDVAAATVKIKIMDNGSVLKVYTRQIWSSKEESGLNPILRIRQKIFLCSLAH